MTWNNQPRSTFVRNIRVYSYNNPGSTIYVNITSLVRKWYSGRYSNFGILLRGREDRNDLIGFYSDESSIPPKLIVNYVRRR